MASCNCTELARVAAAVDGNESKGLAKLAQHPAVIIVTYMMVILPWSLLYNFDFISEKWRSIHRTRRLGHIHLMVAFFPMPMLVFYTHLMHIGNNYTEMMVAITGLLMCLYHVWRTTWGLLQLRAFSKWCGTLIRRMKTLDMIEDLYWKEMGDKKVKDWTSLFRRRDKILCVNNTVIDNELSGTDLSVSIARNKVSRKSDPSTWLKTDEHILCTIRWSGAFLCSFGEFWGGFNRRGFARKEDFEKVFTECRRSLNALHRVTFMKKGNRCSFNAVEWNNGGPYETRFVNGDLLEMIQALAVGKIALENVMGSYTIKALNKYRHPEIGLVCALQYAQCLDEESFDALLNYSDDFNRANLNIARNTHSWELLIWQNREFPRDASSVPRTTTIPKWPWWRLMVPLWDSFTNWRVLQASAHMDNIVVPHAAADLRSGGPLPDCFFEHTLRNQRKVGSSKSYTPNSYGYTGCVLETVRSFLADWIGSSTPRSENTDWKPPLPKATSEFLITRSIEVSGENHVKREQLNQWRWEFQSILQERVATMYMTDSNLPASLDLILLFILAFPGSLTKENRGSTPGSMQSLVVSADHEILSMPGEGKVDMVFHFQTKIAPQTIQVRVWVHGNENAEEKKVEMKLICGKSGTTFNWEDWINCAMGYIKSRDEYMDEHPEWFSEATRNFRKRTPTKAVLSKGMHTVMAPHPGLPELPGHIQVWAGWPFFDIKLVQFEINQWMEKAGYLHGFCDVATPTIGKGWDSNFNAELIHAEEGLLRVMELLVQDNVA